ncbi:SMODS domain-containing nucleotidyltransferase [Phreatobacter sp. HK31-P]
MGVGEDFAAFYEQAVIPADKISSISYRYKRITKQLNKDFWSTDSETAHSLYVGSYGRDTAARGLSDLDMAFLLPATLYHQYNAYTSNGQSALLQAVKNSIRNTYKTSDSFGDGQVVVIGFDDGVTFEVLPVFDNTSGTWTYPNANGGGSWKACNPRAEIAAVQKRHDDTNSNLKKVCRMLRIWRDYCDVPMSGMLIDTLAYQFIESWMYRDKGFLYYDFFFRDFFDFLSKQDQNQQMWRAPGSGSAVSRKGVFEHKARSAHLRALEAIVDATNGHGWKSRQKWREVFGTAYPAS